ncbi:hypothetical protein Gogos_005414 [Gossypium gossypioides]|uniref:Aminotransferase-like plant mobile domain-containing protein n=1 Tax=Gossypium gossypioides TaxID=34282 RepID=A0A7J9D7K9_GOSGO|nr:hypothetical protein [Gossypium gossypioides]
MGLPVDMVKSRLKDKNGPCISWSDIKDAMGKANGVRHLSLFAFVVYGCLCKRFRQVFVPSNRPIEEFLESEWPPNEWVQNLSTLTYQEIEWRAPWMIRSTILIWCGGHL